MDKAPDAFRTISEVADELQVPQHVLRFWESRFAQIKPMKRAGGRRYYRPDDVALLRGIHHLLYGEGYTIRGVQRILKEQGVKFVEGVWQPDAEQPTYRPADREAEEDEPRKPRGRLFDRIQALADSAEHDPEQSGSRQEPPAAGAAEPHLTREQVRKLQATLFELTECRRLLDSAVDNRS